MEREHASGDTTSSDLAAGDATAAPGDPRDTAPPLHPGETLGRYTILEQLGIGGMGLVYAAHDPSLDRKVALKLLHTAAGDSAERARARLVREARAMARLRHPNVITVYEVGMVEERVFLAMELIDGRSLSEWYATGDARRWRRVIAIFLAAGRGLAAAHAAGLVHRDFKPANVLLDDRDGRVMVTDFGLARPSEGDTSQVDSTQSLIVRGVDRSAIRTAETRRADAIADTEVDTPITDRATAAHATPGLGPARAPRAASPATPGLGLAPARAPRAEHSVTASLAAAAASFELSGEPITRTGAVLGTPAYMAPEQHDGELVDARSDQFSFCVALYEALYHERPYPGTTPEELREAIRIGRVRPTPRRSAVPRRVRRILLRGLRAHPADRFPSMPALLAALESAVRPMSRVLRAAVPAVVLVAAAVALAVPATRDPDVTADASCQASLAGAWDPDVAAGVRAVLSARPGGAAVFAQVAARLDADRLAWERARAGICAGAPVQGPVQASAGVFHHRMGCLLDYRDQLASLTELLSAAEERAVAFALGATERLPDPARCSELLPAHGTALALPQDPARRAEVARLRADLARVVTAYETASFARAGELANAVLLAARELNDRYLEAAALYWRGQSRAMSYDIDGIHQDVAAAILLAEEHGYTNILARALIATAAFRVLDPRVDAAQMRELLRRARSAVQRLDEGGELAAWLALIEGYHRSRHGDVAAADASFATARKLYQGVGNAFKAARVDAYWGMSLYMQGRQREAEERLAAGLEILGGELEAMPYEIVCGLELAVRAAERLERYDEARRIHAFLDRKCPTHAPPRGGPARVVTGRVVDDAGQPVAGAEVMAYTGLTGNGRYAVESPGSDRVATARADARGRFRIGQAPDEPLILVTETGAGRSFPVLVSAGGAPGAAPGAGDPAAPGPDHGADVIARLRPWGSVRGRVALGAADRERMIALLPAAPELPYRALILAPVRLDGSFAIERLPAGRYHLGVHQGQRDPIHLVAARWQPARTIEVTPGNATELVVDLASLAPAGAGQASPDLTVHVRNRFHGDLLEAHLWVFPGRSAPASIAALHARWHDGATPLHYAVATRARAQPAASASGDLSHRFSALPAGDLVVCAVPLSEQAPYEAMLGYPPDLDVYCDVVDAAARASEHPVILDVAPMKRR